MSQKPPRSSSASRNAGADKGTASITSRHGVVPTRRPPTRFAETRRRRTRTLATLYTLLGIELIVALFTSPVLAVKQNSLHGVQGLLPTETDASVRAVTFPAGTNWLCAPVGRLERNLRAQPWIQTATVRRRFPNAVVAQITPRRPRVIARTPQGAFEVDAELIPIRPCRPEMEKRLLTVSLATSNPIRPGAPITLEGMATALHIVEATEADPVVRIAKIEVDQSSNIWLNMQNGIRVQCGQIDAIDRKLGLVRKMLQRDPHLGARLTEIDVSSPDWPACRLRETASASPAIGSSARALNEPISLHPASPASAQQSEMRVR